MKIEEVSRDRQSLPTRGLKGSPEMWLKQKRERDAELWGSDTYNYWIVDNKMYDLRDFASKHPGGESWLTLTQGHDVTELFIVHHLNQEKARKILQKYYVGEVCNYISRFSFEEGGVYRAVKNQLLKQMPIKKIQDQTRSKIYGVIFLVLFFISTFSAGIQLAQENYSLCFYLYGSLSSLLLMALLGIGHNFVHHRDNAFKYVYAFTGFTHRQWQIMHCLSHHIYPNLQLDYQAAALEPFAYFLRNQPKNKVYTELILILLYVFIQPINFILKAVVGPIKKKQLPSLQYFVPLSVLLIFYLLSGDLNESVKTHLFVYGLFGFIMNRVLFCNHRTQEVWSEGAQRIQDFGEHTILSTTDTDIRATGFISYLLLGGFNIHTAHHFFPTADQAAHPQILQVIERVCREKGIKKFTSDRISCFLSLSKGLIARTPFQRK